MIIVKNRELLVPGNERYLGTTYDNISENRVFLIPRFSQNGTDLSALNFRLDFLYANGSHQYDTITLVKTVNDEYITLTWPIREEILQVPGTVIVQIRAIDTENTVKWSTFQAAFYVERHLNTPGNYAGSLTEIRQMESDHEYMKGVINELKASLDYTSDAEAWAVGRRKHVDEETGAVTHPAVTEDDETYHNNSKYYADMALYRANNADASAAEAATVVESTRTEFQQAIRAVTQDSEVQNARIGADGTVYPVLKDRLDAEHTDVKSALTKSYNVYGELKQGYYSSGGYYNRNESTRICTEPISVTRGQRIYVNSNGLKYGVQIWSGVPSGSNNLLSESANRPAGTDVITALGDWHIVVFFGKTDNSSISPSDFAGEVRIYSPQIDQLNTGLEDMREFLVNVIPDEVGYSKYINTDVGSTYVLGGSVYFNVAIFPIKPNTHYIAQTKGRTATTKYLGFLDSSNKVISYIEKTVSETGEIVSYDFVSPPNASKAFINVTINQQVLGSTVQYVWLKEQVFSSEEIEERISEQMGEQIDALIEASEKIVSKEKILCVEAAKKTFTATTTGNIADNPLPTFIHVTDMHGDADRFANAIKIAEEVGADAIINTGDQVAYNPTDSVAYIETALAEADTEIPFLPLIGNHESYTATEQEMYTRHIQPFVISSGLTVDSSVTYPTYYYRDFPDHNLRVIGVNQWQYRGRGNMTTQRNYYQAQIDFVCNALLSAPDGYGIVVLIHTPEIATVKTADYPKFYQDEVLYNNVAGTTHPIYEIVDAYISGTVLNKTFSNAEGNTPETYTVNVDFSEKHESEFICYISGHMHRDAVYYLTGVTNKQLMLNEVCTNSWSHRNANGTPGSAYPYYTELTDLPRVIGTPTENSINMYAIDRGRKTVRIVRIGSDMPYDLEKRDCMTIPYAD